MSQKKPVSNSDRTVPWGKWVSEIRVPGIKYKGVRRRPWGKWVSEIRVPGTRTRLWLGSYSAQEAAAVAHDTAVFFLRGPDTLHVNSMNFPWRVEEAYKWAPLSPGSVQRIASDAGMTADAQLTEELLRIENPKEENMFSSDDVFLEEQIGRSDQGFGLYDELSVDDMNQILHLLEECC